MTDRPQPVQVYLFPRPMLRTSRSLRRCSRKISTIVPCLVLLLLSAVTAHAQMIDNTQAPNIARAVLTNRSKMKSVPAAAA